MSNGKVMIIYLVVGLIKKIFSYIKLSISHFMVVVKRNRSWIGFV